MIEGNEPFELPNHPGLSHDLPAFPQGQEVALLVFLDPRSLLPLDVDVQKAFEVSGWCACWVDPGSVLLGCVPCAVQ